MDRLRFFGSASLALALVILATPNGRAGEPPASADQASKDLPYTLYALDELGHDPELGKWVAETIPEVIAPGTWKGQGVLRYYAPKNLLLVYHTPQTQAKVRSFLQNVKKTLPAGHASHVAAAKAPACDPPVVLADYRAPGCSKTATVPAEQSASYPVAAPVRPPKHLFHFIIRYEGEGIVDENVVKAIKAQYPANKKEKADKEPTVNLPASASSADPLGGSASGGNAPPAAETKAKEEKKADPPQADKEDKDKETKELKKADKHEKEDKAP
jgi:hypothetical protein